MLSLVAEKQVSLKIFYGRPEAGRRERHTTVRGLPFGNHDGVVVKTSIYSSSVSERYQQTNAILEARPGRLRLGVYAYLYISFFT